MRYLAVLGRQPKISLAELESLFDDVHPIDDQLAEFEFPAPAKLGDAKPSIKKLGGTLKLAEKIDRPITEFLKTLPNAGKITLGLSDYSHGASAYKAQGEALKLKRLLTKFGHSVRVVPNKTAELSTATSFHNQLWKETKIELIKHGKDFYRVIGVQDIDSYVERDRVRPARDAKVGMLPPKLAQILINLCGDLPQGSVLLDPFCGTGVVLQEAMLTGYVPYGTDINERMVEYSRKNLEWLCRVGASKVSPISREYLAAEPSQNHGPQGSILRGSPTLENGDPRSQHDIVTQGDATSFQWQTPIDAVACETYLGRPMSLPPAEIKLKQEKQECGAIILGFLKNLARQVKSGTPVTVAVPAWLRQDNHYERLNILDEIEELGYNVKRFRNVGQEDLLYHREKQVVAREIIVLRKK